MKKCKNCVVGGAKIKSNPRNCYVLFLESEYKRNIFVQTYVTCDGKCFRVCPQCGTSINWKKLDLRFSNIVFTELDENKIPAEDYAKANKMQEETNIKNSRR